MVDDSLLLSYRLPTNLLPLVKMFLKSDRKHFWASAFPTFA